MPKGIAREGKVRTTGEIPFPSEKSRWVRVRTDRYDVISNASDSRTRAIVADLETLASALTSGPLGGRRGPRSTVFIFGKRRESQPYFNLLFASEMARATGAYVRHGGGGTMFIDGSRPRIERTALHELIHDLLQSEHRPPLWIDEGLAEYFSNATVRNGRVVAGEPVREHAQLLQRRKPIPLGELLTIKAESPGAASSMFYAQSWAAVDWLMLLDEHAFFRFLADVTRGTSVDTALRTHFDKSLREMETAIRWRDRSMRLVTFHGRAAAAPPSEPVDRATLLFELGSFLSHVAGAEKESARHFAEALRVDPHHARTLAAVGEYERAVAAAPHDPEVHLLFAESLLDTAIGPFAGIFTPKEGDLERFRRARALAQHALTIGGEAGRARGIIGTSFLVENDFTPGIEELEQARALAAERMDFALNLYAMYLRTGARAKADALFASTFENARDKQTVFAARNVLVAAETARANELAVAGKLDDAAQAVRDLAAMTPDATARRELELQAAKLAATAAVNRHITRYNEAVALANAGKNRDAVKVLDALLKEATDTSVVKDAQRLRAEVAKRRR